MNKEARLRLIAEAERAQREMLDTIHMYSGPALAHIVAKIDELDHLMVHQRVLITRLERGESDGQG